MGRNVKEAVIDPVADDPAAALLLGDASPTAVAMLLLE
jgi:hypothetical protein